MYGSVALADAYLDVRPDPRGIWSSKSDDEKTRYLNEASDLVDNLNFVGDKTAEDQEHEFPRDGSDTVPANILKAVYEIAKNLADGRNVEYEHETRNTTQGTFGSFRRTKTPEMFSPASVHSIPSVKAWSYLRPYLRDGESLTLERGS